MLRPAQPSSHRLPAEKLHNEHVTELGPQEPLKAPVSSPPSGSVWVTAKSPAGMPPSQILSESQPGPHEPEAVQAGQGVNVRSPELPITSCFPQVCLP